MLTFEFRPPHTFSCECCSGTSTTLTRFVSKDGDAYAVYYAGYSDNHPDRIVKLAVSIGEWGEDAAPELRTAFALELWSGETSYQVAAVDAAKSPWSNTTILGTMLNREEALAHPLISEVFHLTDHIVIEDALVIAYLDAN